MKLLYISLILSLLWLLPLEASEKQKKPIPDPLSLNEALVFSEHPHPVLSIANLRVQSALNSKSEAESTTDFNAYFEGRLRYVEPSSVSSDKTHDDHRAAIILSKTLSDFGRSDSAIESSEYSLKVAEIKRKRLIVSRRLEIMQKFFDVILADMNFYRYNEELATAFVKLDKLRDRRELGQVSDLDIMQQDVVFRKVSYLHKKSENEQRITRAKLAVAMGRPGELVVTVSKPKLPQINLKLLEVEELSKIAFKNNYELLALQSKLEAARAKVEFARKKDGPSLNLEAGSYAYSRERANRDELQVGLVLRVPLTDGSRTDVAVAKALNQVHLIQSDIEHVKTKVSASILTLSLEMDALRRKLTQMQTLTEYRELYLDRSRALYEMEVKTDLGDSMVRISEAEHNLLKAEYEMMLVLTKLELEVGQSLENITKGKGQ